MYEGKNIHFSAVDNKALCSYSSKLCKQRRLNGYAFCLRHILEDPSAPFKQCTQFVKNRQQCLNPVPRSSQTEFCNCHNNNGAKQQSNKERSRSKAASRPPADSPKNGLSPTDANRLSLQNRLKTKIQLCRGRSNEAGGEGSGPDDPYAFPDVDPPAKPAAAAKTSPPQMTSPTSLLSLQLPLTGPLTMTSPVSSTRPMASPSAWPSAASTPERPGSVSIAKLYPELAEKLERVRTKSEPKGAKTTAATKNNARTMNRLQTKIAQNKIKDKLKNKSQSNSTTPEQQPSTPLTPMTSFGSSSPNPAMVAETKPASTVTALTRDPALSSPPAAAAFGGGNRAAKEPSVRKSSSVKKQHQGKCTSPGEDLVVARTPSAISALLSSTPAPVMSSRPSGPSGSAISQMLQNPPLPHSLSLFNATTATISKPGNLTVKTENQAGPLSATKPNAQRPASLDTVAHQVFTMPDFSLPGFSPHKPRDGHCVRSADVKTEAVVIKQEPLMESPVTVPQQSLSSQIHGSSAGSPSTMPPSEGKSETLPASSATPPVPNQACYVRPKRPRDILSETEARRRLKRHSAVRTYAYHASQRVHDADLIPMGIDSSDESDTDDLLSWQRNWLLSSSDEDDNEDELDEELASNIRKTKLVLYKSKLRRQFTQLRHMHGGNQSRRKHETGDLKALITAARLSSTTCVRALAEVSQHSHHANVSRKDGKTAPCLYNKTNDTEPKCPGSALPFTNHCANHIMYNVEQQVFDYCTAKFSDNTQCCVPVFDPRHELPLCPEHAAKADNYEKNHEPRPKKARKKTKPSALTRPPKKGKKKKNQRKTTRPQKPVSSPELPQAPSGSVGSPSQSADILPLVGSPAKMSPPSSLPQLPLSHHTPPTIVVNQRLGPVSSNFVLPSSTNSGGTLPVSHAQHLLQTPRTSAAPANQLQQALGLALGQGESSNQTSLNRAKVGSYGNVSQGLSNQTQASEKGVDPLDSDLGGDLAESFSPGTIDKELELPLDTEQATKFLDEHDLHDVLNKLPDEAFDLLAGCADDKNGEFSVNPQAALDRAWEEVSQDLTKDTMEKLSQDTGISLTPDPTQNAMTLTPDASTTAMTLTSDHATSSAACMTLTSDPSAGGHISLSQGELPNDDELTKQIADSLLNHNPLSPTGSIGDDLGHDNLNDLASSLSANDLKNISQVLSGSLLNSALGVEGSAGNPVATATTLPLEGLAQQEALQRHVGLLQQQQMCSQAGPALTLANMTSSQAGPALTLANLTSSQAGPALTLTNMTSSQAGPGLTLANMTSSQAGPALTLANMTSSQAGPALTLANMTSSQAGPALTQAGPALTLANMAGFPLLHTAMDASTLASAQLHTQASVALTTNGQGRSSGSQGHSSNNQGQVNVNVNGQLVQPGDGKGSPATGVIGQHPTGPQGIIRSTLTAPHLPAMVQVTGGTSLQPTLMQGTPKQGLVTMATADNKTVQLPAGLIPNGFQPLAAAGAVPVQQLPGLKLAYPLQTLVPGGGVVTASLQPSMGSLQPVAGGPPPNTAPVFTITSMAGHPPTNTQH